MAIAKKLSVIITFCVLVLTPFSVGAIPLQTVAYQGASVQYEFNGNHRSGIAAEFQLTLGNGSDEFGTNGYCVELEETISIPKLYDVELKSVSFRPNGMDAAWLMNEYAFGLENLDAKAALQLAIWDTIYEDAFTVLSATSNSIEKLYADYINGLATAKSIGPYNTDFADNFSVSHQNGIQDLLIYTPAAVPEPSTIFLMGFGLIAFGFIRNKWNKRK